jgi:hypothetical protein
MPEISVPTLTSVSDWISPVAVTDTVSAPLVTAAERNVGPVSRGRARANTTAMAAATRTRIEAIHHRRDPAEAFATARRSSALRAASVSTLLIFPPLDDVGH